MTEQDLIKLGFNRVDVDADESGDTPFHYYEWYPYEDAFLALLSDSDDEVIDGNWKVILSDDMDIVFDNVDDVKTLMDILKRNVRVKQNSNK